MLKSWLQIPTRSAQCFPFPIFNELLKFFKVSPDHDDFWFFLLDRLNHQVIHQEGLDWVTETWLFFKKSIEFFKDLICLKYRSFRKFLSYIYQIFFPSTYPCLSGLMRGFSLGLVISASFWPNRRNFDRFWPISTFHQIDRQLQGLQAQPSVSPDWLFYGKFRSE